MSIAIANEVAQRARELHPDYEWSGDFTEYDWLNEETSETVHVAFCALRARRGNWGTYVQYAPELPAQAGFDVVALLADDLIRDIKRAGGSA